MDRYDTLDVLNNIQQKASEPQCNFAAKMSKVLEYLHIRKTREPQSSCGLKSGDRVMAKSNLVVLC